MPAEKGFGRTVTGHSRCDVTREKARHPQQGLEEQQPLSLPGTASGASGAPGVSAPSPVTAGRARGRGERPSRGEERADSVQAAIVRRDGAASRDVPG